MNLIYLTLISYIVEAHALQEVHLLVKKHIETDKLENIKEFKTFGLK